jgi:hypothetical protein
MSMSNDNYLFFDNESKASPDSSIYRIFSVERLLELFATRKLTLVKPAMWDDPFENFILKSKALFENGEKVSLGYSDSIFGQCWSLNEETDAMWRIYSPLKNGVKVRSTSRKLREVLSSDVHLPDISAFVGVVKYRTEQSLLRMTNDRARMNRKIFSTNGQGQAETLLFKRDGFSHEKEVRLIYFDNCDANAKNKIFNFNIDPFDLIDEIKLDPRMNQDLANVYIQHFKGLGFNGEVSRSGFYELPEITLKI